MRKFFKSLAVLLALTLIVGVIPAAAADSLSLQDEKVLYIGGSNGQTAEGAKCKVGAKKLVANMIKGIDKDTMSVDLKSSDKTIVGTNKAGRIVAKGLGTATVTVTVYDADEVQLYKKDLKVIVKKNADSVAYEGIVNGASYSVGQKLVVKLPRKGVDTDQRSLVSSDAKIATVTEQKESKRVYDVEFLAKGEVTFTASAYQSAKYPKATASEEIKVTVTNPVAEEVNVKSSRSFEVVFASDITQIYKAAKDFADGTVYRKTEAGATIPFTGVEKVEAKENVLTVTMFNKFDVKTKYYVDLNPDKELSFEIAGYSNKDVDSIKILTTQLEKDDATAGNIKVAYYDVLGVDITEGVNAQSDHGTLSLTSADNLKLWPQGSNTATMYTVGDVVALTAKFTFYDKDNNMAAVTKEATQNIQCVKKPVPEKTGLVYSIGTDPKKDNPVHFIALEDTGLKFRAWIENTLRGNKQNDVMVGSSFSDLGSTYARVADTSIAMITATAGNDYSIVGNQVGSTYVFICYTANGKEVILDSCPIEVKPKRYAASVSVDLSQSTLNYSSNSDAVKVTVTVKDNYNDIYTKTTPTLAVAEGSKNFGDTGATFGAAGADGKFVLILDNSNVTYKKDGSLGFTVKAGDKSNQIYKEFSLAAKGTTGNGYSFTADKTTLDTSINKIKTPVATATIDFKSLKDGYYVSNLAIDKVLAKTEAAPVNAEAASLSALGLKNVLKIYKDNQSLDLNATINNTSVKYQDLIDTSNIAGGKVTLKSYATVGAATNGAIVKLPAGNYTFDLYVLTADGKSIDGSARRVNITVSDSQGAPTWKKVEQNRSKKASAEECFELKFDNVTLTDLVATVTENKDTTGATTSYFVSKITASIAITDNNGAQTGILQLPVEVNTVLDK